MARKTHIIIDQGTTFSNTVTPKYANNVAIDITGHSANAQIRKHYTSTNAISFSTTVNSNGTITFSLAANQTSNVAAGQYVYDINIISSSNTITRVIEGVATITPRVTR